MLDRNRTTSGSHVLLTSVLLVGLGPFLFAPPTWSQANVQGQRQTLPYTSASPSLQPIAQAGTSPDFTLGISPSAQVVEQGGSTPYTTRLSVINGFNGAATLSVSGLPAGATASFVPPSITGPGSSTLTVSTGTSTLPGSYSLTVKGTSGALTHTATTMLIVTQSSGPTIVNFGSGFTASGVQFNGHAKLDETHLLLTDTTSNNQVASAFSTAPVSVTTFTSAFSFQLMSPSADGFTFTIQNAGITAIGSPGGGLGYGKISTSTAAIGKSVAVKFDLFNNSGEGPNSTGLYTNGVPPTVPATTLDGGVNLHSGDVFLVQMNYDGVTLTLVVTDAIHPDQAVTVSFPIDIPATVGGNTAFVGFTAATGGTTATQEILNWTYSVAPGFSLAITPPSRALLQGAHTSYDVMVTATNGFTGTVALSISDLPPGVTAFFSQNQTITGSGVAVIAVDPIPLTIPPNLYTMTVTGVSGSITRTATAHLGIGQSGVGINLPSGFGGPSPPMVFNGHTRLNGTRLQLTDTTSINQASSAFWFIPVNVQNFTNTFTFQLTNPNADGFTFTIQNFDATALGSSGAGLGYGKFSTRTAFIPTSVAIKFDLFSNSGEGTNSTGLYKNGASPTVPATALGGGIDLHSGHVFQVQMHYSVSTLTLTMIITDLTAPANTFTTSFPIHIPNTIGSDVGFIGFTGGTGGQAATQEILNWTYSTP